MQSAKILLLDLDGTLVDSVGDLTAALNRLLAESGADALPLAEVRTMVGDGARRLVERGVAARGLTLDPAAATARFLELYAQALTAETRPYPGVAETLESLRRDGWRLAVCTNKPESPSREILRSLGLAGLFDAVAGGDSFAVKKPDPLPLLKLLEQLGAADAKPGAVVVGDGRNDLLAAQAAGLPAVWCRYGYIGGVDAALPRAAEIERFDALPAALGGLRGASKGA